MARTSAAPTQDTHSACARTRMNTLTFASSAAAPPMVEYPPMPMCAPMSICMLGPMAAPNMAGAAPC
eukprot:1001145-Pleurochrysis_carterae.AAC.1